MPRHDPIPITSRPAQPAATLGAAPTVCWLQQGTAEAPRPLYTSAGACFAAGKFSSDDGYLVFPPTTTKLWGARVCADTLPAPYGGWESTEGEEGLFTKHRPCPPCAPQPEEEPQNAAFLPSAGWELLETCKSNCIAPLPRGNKGIKSLQNYIRS